jgi:hypothetical protein
MNLAIDRNGEEKKEREVMKVLQREKRGRDMKQW